MKKTVLFLIAFAAAFFSAAADQTALLKQTLSKTPWFAGKNLSESRKKELAASATAKTAIARADQYLAQSFPFPFPDLYLDFQKTGNRSRF